LADFEALIRNIRAAVKKNKENKGPLESLSQEWQKVRLYHCYGYQI
jgi:hypothetical protein